MIRGYRTRVKLLSCYYVISIMSSIRVLLTRTHNMLLCFLSLFFLFFSLHRTNNLITFLFSTILAFFSPPTRARVHITSMTLCWKITIKKKISVTSRTKRNSQYINLWRESIWRRPGTNRITSLFTSLKVMGMKRGDEGVRGYR